MWVYELNIWNLSGHIEESSMLVTLLKVSKCFIDSFELIDVIKSSYESPQTNDTSGNTNVFNTKYSHNDDQFW